MTAAVELINVVKQFGDVTAVKATSLAFEKGQLITLLGPSGCGKTTILRMIAGLELATSGTIQIGGRDVTNLPATARDVSMVFQSYALFPHMTVRENVAYGLVTSGQPKAEAHAGAERGLERVGLDGFGDRLPSALSGGQQQRVAVARALVLEPEVLLFDEPLSNLDARLRRQMREDIRLLQKDVGFTAVYVTHDQDEALAISDRIVLMDRACVAQDASPRELYEHPVNAFTAKFIGEANIFEVDEVTREGELDRVRVDAVTVRLPHRPRDGAVKLAVRPHAVRIEPSSAEGISGEVLGATYLGDRMEYVIGTKVGEVFARGDVDATNFARGDAVSIGFAETGVVLVRA